MIEKIQGGYDYRLEMMPFKKFAQSQKAIVQNNKRVIIGSYLDKKDGSIINETFDAEDCGNAEKTYKLYLLWNNIYFDEDKEFISAKWEEINND